MNFALGLQDYRLINGGRSKGFSEKGSLRVMELLLKKIMERFLSSGNKISWSFFPEQPTHSSGCNIIRFVKQLRKKSGRNF